MTQETRTGSREPHAGQDLGSIDFPVTEEVVRHYFDGLELDAAACAERSPFGYAVAPSMIVCVPDGAYSGRGGFENAFGNLWMRQEWELHRPLVPGEIYDTSGRTTEIYQRRDRTVVNMEVAVRDPAGDLMALGRHHQSYLLGQTSGEVALRDPQAKPGARRFEAPAGEAVEPLERTITLEMCGTFFHGRANYHTDRQAAEALGFHDVVVGGRMTLSYAGELMERRFGRSWWESGRLDVKFTNVVWPDDRVTARAVITDREAEDGGTRAHAFLWMEKQDGTVVLVGSASAIE